MVKLVQVGGEGFAKLEPFWDGYRDDIAQRCFEYAATAGDLNLLLYDVTTLYFEAEKDVWKIFTTVARERKRREIDPALAVLRKCAEDSAEIDASPA